LPQSSLIDLLLLAMFKTNQSKETMTNQISEKREISFNLAILKIKQHGNLDELKDFLDKMGVKENYKAKHLYNWLGY
jgi:hypothetical protein